MTVFIWEGWVNAKMPRKKPDFVYGCLDHFSTSSQDGFSSHVLHLAFLVQAKLKGHQQSNERMEMELM